jgi:hypothetical protein
MTAASRSERAAPVRLRAPHDLHALCADLGRVSGAGCTLWLRPDANDNVNASTRYEERQYVK